VTATGRVRAPVGRDARNEKEQRDGTAIGFGCRDSENFWEGIRGLGMIELNDEKVLKIIFSACFILVDFSGCHKPTPLKMNLVLKIRLVPKEMGKLLLQSIFTFPRNFFYSMSAPLHSANPYF